MRTVLLAAVVLSKIILFNAAGLQALGQVKQLIDNDRVTIWDIAIAQGLADGNDAVTGNRSLDCVVVSLAPESVQGNTVFVARGNDLQKTLRLSGASRVAMVVLKDKVVPPVPNESGYPDSFPRPGSKKVLENNRVAVWDYTFELN